MPIPELNEDGVLPVGIYDCTLDEIGGRFGCFQTTDRRVHLFKDLSDLVKEEVMAGIATEILINGSFITSKIAPEDIDLIVVLPEGYILKGMLPPFRYNATSKSRLRRRYRFDVAVVKANSPEYEYWFNLFRRVKYASPQQRKGILRIKL